MAPAPLCLKCNENKGRLGAAPNKYCYRKACVDAGRAAGHIKSTGTPTTPQVRPGDRRDGGDDTEDAVPTSTFEISELKNLLGLR